MYLSLPARVRLPLVYEELSRGAVPQGSFARATALRNLSALVIMVQRVQLSAVTKFAPQLAQYGAAPASPLASVLHALARPKKRARLGAQASLELQEQDNALPHRRIRGRLSELPHQAVCTAAHKRTALQPHAAERSAEKWPPCPASWPRPSSKSPTIVS